MGRPGRFIRWPAIGRRLVEELEGEIGVNLRKAIRIDFTGSGAGGFESFDKFDERVIRYLRAGAASKLVVIVDSAIFMGEQENSPRIVTDHLNLTGDNPLVGPNDPCGTRFPVVNEIYMMPNQIRGPNETLPKRDCLDRLRTCVVAGLSPGVVPSKKDEELIKSLGADLCSYNLVPSMIVAAHAGMKVLGIVVPGNKSLAADLAAALLGEVVIK